MKLPELLFHGSNVDFQIPSVSECDGVFWTANNSAIAQSYIKSCRGYVQTGYIFHSDLGRPVKPNLNDPLYSVVKMMGHQAKDIVYDRNGISLSYKVSKDYPTYSAAIKFIEEVLGYKSENINPKSFTLRTSGWDSKERQDTVIHSDSRISGFLYIVSGHESMRWYDTRKSSALHPDNPHYPSINDIRLQGYDGIISADFCKASPGKVERLFYGIFQESIPDLTVWKVPAANHDCGEVPGANLEGLETKEFKAWKNAKDAISSIIDSSKNNGTITLSELRRRSNNGQIARIA